MLSLARIRGTSRGLTKGFPSRGYPEIFLPTTPYDPAKRERALERLRRRNFSDRQDRKCAQKLITLPVRYSDQQRSLRITAQAKKLIDELRSDLGQEFCADTRIIVSNIGLNGMLSHRHTDLILCGGG